MEECIGTCILKRMPYFPTFTLNGIRSLMRCLPLINYNGGAGSFEKYHFGEGWVTRYAVLKAITQLLYFPCCAWHKCGLLVFICVQFSALLSVLVALHLVKWRIKCSINCHIKDLKRCWFCFVFSHAWLDYKCCEAAGAVHGSTSECCCTQREGGEKLRSRHKCKGFG